jgi:hypothetical protein
MKAVNPFQLSYNPKGETMTKYNDPKTGKTVEAKNKREAMQRLSPKVTKKPDTPKKVSKVSKSDKEA